MPFADINGISMYYEEFGEGSPIVLVAGFNADTSFFDALIPELSEDHRVIVFDNRGSGKTVYPGPGIDNDDLVEDVLALLDHLHVERTHLLGWSFGAHISQEFAIRHPERLISLTLISAYPYRPARSSYFMNGICDCALTGGSSEYISMMTSAFCFTEDFFSGMEAKGRSLRTISGTNAVRAKEQMGALDRFDTRDRVHLISVPTLSIHGLSDIMVEPRLGDYISDRIPGCKVMRIENVGHIIRPSMYSKELLEHVRAHDIV